MYMIFFSICFGQRRRYCDRENVFINIYICIVFQFFFLAAAPISSWPCWTMARLECAWASVVCRRWFVDSGGPSLWSGWYTYICKYIYIYMHIHINTRGSGQVSVIPLPSSVGTHLHHNCNILAITETWGNNLWHRMGWLWLVGSLKL